MNLEIKKLSKRFWPKVSVTKHPKKCWNWKASITTHGYGQIMWRGKPVKAHRASWFIHHGSIPHGLHVLHKCDNRRCVRPGHLFLGTNDDNAEDREQKGRTAWGRMLPQAKLSPQDVRYIRKAFRSFKASVSKKFKIKDVTVSSIIWRNRWARLEE